MVSVGVEAREQTRAAGLRDLWPYARNWWGLTVAAATLLAAAYYGPKKMLETWDWYLYRWWDSKVLKVLNDKRPQPGWNSLGRKCAAGKPVSMSEIANATGFSEKRISACLIRLHKKGEAQQQEDGEWKAVDIIQ